MSILIGADFVPTENNAAIFAEADVQTLCGQRFKDLAEGADFRIFNLEMPLATAPAPIDKCGPNLIASPSVIAAYSALKVDLFTLANNHILDYGEKALADTEALLDEAKIAHIGSGGNPSEAKAPYFFSYAGRRVGVYACAEHEFSVVTDKTAGANPFDPLETPDDVREIKAQCDYLIVLYHGGKEHYPYPSPNLQKTCRKLVSCGADLVVCQHSHCVGCEENYLGKKIVYGQGNTLFCLSRAPEWQTGLLLSLDENFALSYLPLRQTENGTSLAEGEDAEEILKGFYQRSEEILQEGFVERKYGEYAEETIADYLAPLDGKHSLFFYALNKLSRGKLLAKHREKLFRKTYRLILENHVECEAHRELFVRGLKEMRK